VSNFTFLDKYDTRVARLARQAEGYVYSDPESCLFKLRLIIETMARRALEREAPQLVSADLGSMLGALQRSGTLPSRRADSMHAVRRDGNAAVHGEPTPSPTAMRRLHDVHRLSGWYVTIVKRGARAQLGQFTPPPRPQTLDQDALRRAERLEDEIEAKRRQTRDALRLFSGADDVDAQVARLRHELEGLDHVASEAGEPLVDADSAMLLMAMELEQVLEHAELGLSSREAKREAEKQLEAVKAQLEQREHRYARERARLAAATVAAPRPI
jgi:type I restriction enzyme R subunit